MLHKNCLKLIKSVRSTTWRVLDIHSYSYTMSNLTIRSAFQNSGYCNLATQELTYGKLYSTQNSMCVRPSITTQPPTLPNITHRPHTPRVIIKFCILRCILMYEYNS